MIAKVEPFEDIDNSFYSYDRVKVIFHPEFLNSTNPLFGLDYQVIQWLSAGKYTGYPR